MSPADFTARGPGRDPDRDETLFDGDMGDRHQQLRLLEALLFAAAEPLDEATLAARLPDGADLPALLAALAEQYANRGVRLVRVGRNWALRTAPDLAPFLRIETRVGRKLSQAAVETLAIIAYHQPVTRAEIEEIRGKSLSRGTLDLLLEAGWVRPKGRRRTPGRPVTWGTSDTFLDHFGLESLEDLPGVDELKAAGLLDARPAIATAVAPAGEDAAEGPLMDGEPEEEPEEGEPEEDEPEEGEPEEDEAGGAAETVEGAAGDPAADSGAVSTED